MSTFENGRLEVFSMNHAQHGFRVSRASASSRRKPTPPRQTLIIIYFPVYLFVL
jgi:hypothetical protein